MTMSEHSILTDDELAEIKAWNLELMRSDGDGFREVLLVIGNLAKSVPGLLGTIESLKAQLAACEPDKHERLKGER